MSTRCSIIFDDDKHIFWECFEDKINLEFYKKEHKNNYGDPQITIDELFKIVKFIYDYNIEEHAEFRKKVTELVSPQKL